LTAESLMQYFEKYYGERYEGAFRMTTQVYLSAYGKDWLKAAMTVIPMRVPRRYGKSPCVADFEANMREIREAMPKPKALPEPALEPLTDEELAELNKLTERLYRRLNRSPETAPESPPDAREGGASASKGDSGQKGYFNPVPDNFEVSMALSDHDQNFERGNIELPPGFATAYSKKPN